MSILQNLLCDKVMANICILKMGKNILDMKYLMDFRFTEIEMHGKKGKIEYAKEM